MQQRQSGSTLKTPGELGANCQFLYAADRPVEEDRDSPFASSTPACHALAAFRGERNALQLEIRRCGEAVLEDEPRACLHASLEGHLGSFLGGREGERLVDLRGRRGRLRGNAPFGPAGAQGIGEGRLRFRDSPGREELGHGKRLHALGAVLRHGQLGIDRDGQPALDRPCTKHFDIGQAQIADSGTAREQKRGLDVEGVGHRSRQLESQGGRLPHGLVNLGHQSAFVFEGESLQSRVDRHLEVPRGSLNDLAANQHVEHDRTGLDLQPEQLLGIERGAGGAAASQGPAKAQAVGRPQLRRELRCVAFARYRSQGRGDFQGRGIGRNRQLQASGGHFGNAHLERGKTRRAVDRRMQRHFDPILARLGHREGHVVAALRPEEADLAAVERDAVGTGAAHPGAPGEFALPRCGGRLADRRPRGDRQR